MHPYQLFARGFLGSFLGTLIAIPHSIPLGISRARCIQPVPNIPPQPNASADVLTMPP
jgi:hypothetical protein